ncbi:TIGR03960 family B12-binding radical SAM protein [Christensenellaceae bacterium OttesenSCG-928-K19]|nr:TIGR03960 family B12-binding radical SAM protein [Christensenellaceae bacterium OttesenSCG-928-K19]
MKWNDIEKPARYMGGELNSIYKEDAKLRFALCFPDVYEVGMSNLAIHILYEVLNSMEDVYAQRAFCPWVDMAAKLRQEEKALTTLECGQPLHGFDMVGFNLSYEMCYSNVLLMLDLGRIPMLAADRGENDPIVIGGGACTVNPEPIADFFDLFVVGEGEEVIVELCELYLNCEKTGESRKEFLRLAANIQGVYVPFFYQESYAESGEIASVCALEGVPEKVKRRFVEDFDGARAMHRPVLPYIGTVHDRCTLEIMRGCANGCRFCQAGYMTRPVRERSVERVMAQAESVISATGYDEISLCSLSSGDYSHISELMQALMDRFEKQRVSVALPSLRVDSFRFAEKLQQVRRTGVTFAPEAGTQRLRDVINKNITDEDILGTVYNAFASGASTVKLYFMIGLPTETMEDIDGIVELVRAIREEYYRVPKPERGGSLSITVSASCFVPKAGTPFQWEAQEGIDSLREKQWYLKDKLRMKGVRFQYHDAYLSFLEAVFARGDRRLSAVLRAAYEDGAVFDAWQDHFSFERYQKAFEGCGIDPAFYTTRKRSFNEILPYSHIDSLISGEYLVRECEKAYSAQATPSCSQKCAACGLQGAGCHMHGGEE